MYVGPANIFPIYFTAIGRSRLCMLWDFYIIKYG